MADPAYREQLSVPWWSHLVVFAVAVILGLESSFLAGGALGQTLVVLAFVVVFEIVVWRYGSRVVEVTPSHLRAGSWRLRIDQVRAVAVLDAAATRRELRGGGEEVYRCTRSWVPTAVLLQVDDPDDKPLWLLSTRRPHLLAAALTAAAQGRVDAQLEQAAGSPAWTRTPGAP